MTTRSGPLYDELYEMRQQSRVCMSYNLGVVGIARWRNGTIYATQNEDVEQTISIAFRWWSGSKNYKLMPK